MRRIVLISVAVALLGAAIALQPRPAKASVVVKTQASSAKPTALAYHDAWRKLWEDHITWTRMVIIGVADSLPGTADYTTRLLQNYEDMETALEPYFDEDDVEELGDLIQDHLVIAKQILETVKAGGDPTALIATWRQNGTDIATKMAEMNPTYWPFSMGNPMWQDHLTATLDEATAHFANNFAADISAYDRVHDMALEMADFFSSGVIKTNAQFKREICVP
jgi:hypothetical protein